MRHSLVGERDLQQFRLEFSEDLRFGRSQSQPSGVKLGENLHAQFQVILVQLAVYLRVTSFLQVLENDRRPAVAAEVRQVALRDQIGPVAPRHLRVEHLLVLVRVERRRWLVLGPIFGQQLHQQREAVWLPREPDHDVDAVNLAASAQLVKPDRGRVELDELPGTRLAEATIVHHLRQQFLLDEGDASLPHLVGLHARGSVVKSLLLRPRKQICKVITAD